MSDPSTGPEGRTGTLSLLWLLLLGLANGLVWLSFVPPWQAPDEPKHFEYVRLLAEGEGLVAFATEAEAGDPELQAWIVGSMDRHRFWWYGHAPGYDPARAPQRFAELWPDGSHTAFYRSSPAYYLLAAAFQPADRMLGLYLARSLGLLMLGLTILFTGWAARELFPSDPLVRYGAPAFVALHPMQAFLVTGVNNDALANLLAALAALLVARLLSRGFGAARLLLIAASVLAAILVKRTALYLLPMALLALPLGLALRGRRPARALAGGLAGLSAGGLLALLWVTGGGWQRLPEAWRFGISRYLFNEPDQLGRILAYLRAEGVLPLLLEYLRGMLDGFWGSFGWQMIHFPDPVYAGLAILTALAGLGLLRRLLQPGTSTPSRAAILVFGAGLGLAAAGALAFFASYLGQAYAPPPQGRYLFAAMLPAAILFTAGLSAWLPADLRARALPWFFLCLLAYDLAALFGLVLPYFYR